MSPVDPNQNYPQTPNQVASQMDGDAEIVMEFSNYSSMGRSGMEASKGQWIPYDRQQAVSYLMQGPDNAIILSNQDAAWSRLLHKRQATTAAILAVWRGAGGGVNSYYFGYLPLTDPGDAEGGDLTADQAVDAAAQRLRDGLM